VAGQIERSFRLVAFFIRVPLEDLGLVHPEAAACETKDDFLRPHLAALRALVQLGLTHTPAEVNRLALEFPEVRRMLASGMGWTPPENAAQTRSPCLGGRQQVGRMGTWQGA
jgi:hypothetical protein